MINQIVQGDCLEVMKDIPDKSVDMILCDLPYGTTACKWDTIIPFEPLWEQYERVIKDNGAIVLFSSQPFTSALVMSNPKLFKYEWIIEKSKPTGHLNAKIKPLLKHDNVAVFAKGKINYAPQGLIDCNKVVKRTNKGCYGECGKTTTMTKTGYPVSVQRFKYDAKPLHPTQKPVALFEYLIRTYTNEGEVVLDNCIGSGTTAIASLNTGRFFIGIEMDEHYHQVATKRVQEWHDKQGLFT